jgi:hypothetical protein
MGRPVAWWRVEVVGVVDGRDEVMNGVRVERKSSIVIGWVGCREIVCFDAGLHGQIVCQ